MQDPLIQIYLLDFETLEGEWLSFIPHPLVTSTSVAPRLVEDLDLRIKQEGKRNNASHELLEYFNGLTSEEIGIFHSWEERNLSQLPLAQCFVQAVNPLTSGPADLLPEVICAGLTHEEAKRNAGLTGIEMYVSKWIDSFVRNQDDHNDPKFMEGTIGIGAGETIEEAICRGLQAYLDEKLSNRMDDGQNGIFDVQLGSIEDQPCKVYVDALSTLNGTPTIDLKEDILGFPVISVRSNGQRITSAGLNITLALRNALQQALLNTQNHQINPMVVDHEMESAVFRENKEFKLDIPSCEDMTRLELLQSSMQVLHQNGKRLFVYDLAFEPFLKQELAGVFGVQIRRGGILMAAQILMDGKGLLADIVYHQLSENYSLKRQSILEEVSEEIEFVLVLHDAWHPSAYPKVEKRMRSLGLPWLRGFVSFGEGIIGPFVRPDTMGCSYCADMRRILAGPDRQEMWKFQESYGRR